MSRQKKQKVQIIISIPKGKLCRNYRLYPNNVYCNFLILGEDETYCIFDMMGKYTEKGILKGEECLKLSEEEK